MLPNGLILLAALITVVMAELAEVMSLWMLVRMPLAAAVTT